MKKLIVILLAGYTFVISQGTRNAAADDEGSHGTPLRKLAGAYSATYQGSVALCLANTSPFPQVQCGSPNSMVAPLTVLGVGGATFDAAGNFCIPFTETDADLPVGPSPATFFAFYNVGKVTNYDPTTGTGDKSDISYVGGHCHGAIFDSTGATVISTVHSHFTVSNNGKRIDGAVTSLTNPAGAIGGFSIAFTFLHQ